MTEALRATKVSEVVRPVSGAQGCEFVVMQGERRAIIGPNGAGKSTLFNIIAGQFPPTSGAIYLDGRPSHRAAARPDLVSTGLTRTFQRNQLFQGLTRLGQRRTRLCGQHRDGHRGPTPRRRRAIEEKSSRHPAPGAPARRMPAPSVRNLAYGEQRQLELALALAGRRRSCCSTSRPPACRRPRRKPCSR